MVMSMGSQVFADGSYDSGPGDALLFTYYDVRSEADGGLGLTDNYFTVINTSTQWVQSHVRIRTGDCSVEILDFDVLQSPRDVFAFDLYEDQGEIVFASCDSNTRVDSGFTLNFDRDNDGTDDCFVLSSGTFPAMLSLITTCGDCATGNAVTTTEARELAKKGYVEVIEEGRIRPRTGSNKNLCYDSNGMGDDGVDGITIPGKTLNDLANTNCAEDITPPFADLLGRQYYAEVDQSATPPIVMRLAQLNALSVDSFRGVACIGVAFLLDALVGPTDPADICNFEFPDDTLILHQNTYTDELNASGSPPFSNCTGDDFGPGQEDCYAYAAPQTTDAAGTTASGANDMNQCFYKNMDSDNNLVINKFGAAATYGPTLADVTSDRNGHLTRTAINLTVGSIAMSLSDIPTTFVSILPFLKQYVDSHYFFAPLPGPFDIQTGFAFLFPFKHFIGENETITARAIYDNEENTQTIDLSKFISPGLPTPSDFSDEAEIFRLTPPFNEGWIRFEVTASNATTNCADETVDPLVDPQWPGSGCEVYGIVADWFNSPVFPIVTTGYMPGLTGAVFTTGSENMGVSPFNYNRDTFLIELIGLGGMGGGP
jgi:hypothetical protein